MIGIHQLLQSGATSGAGVAVKLDGEVSRLAFYITTTDTTVSAGAITFEEAPSDTYAGTWAAMVSDSAGSGAITPVQASTLVRKFNGPFGAVRARISTNITGGAAVTVDLFGNIDS